MWCQEVLDLDPFDADDVYKDRPLADLAVLCRSAIPRQRIEAVRRLTEVMRSMHAEVTGPAAGVEAALEKERLPRGLPLLLRCALDDSNASMLPVALEALLVFVVRVSVFCVAPVLVHTCRTGRDPSSA